jgi:hypothetical protein
MEHPDPACLDFPDLQREFILNLWELGITAETIAGLAGLANAGSVTRTVMSARRRGDSRAVLRKARGGRKRAIAVTGAGREGR